MNKTLLLQWAMLNAPKKALSVFRHSHFSAFLAWEEKEGAKQLEEEQERVGLGFKTTERLCCVILVVGEECSCPFTIPGRLEEEKKRTS